MGLRSDTHRCRALVYGVERSSYQANVAPKGISLSPRSTVGRQDPRLHVSNKKKTTDEPNTSITNTSHDACFDPLFYIVMPLQPGASFEELPKIMGPITALCAVLSDGLASRSPGTSQPRPRGAHPARCRVSCCCVARGCRLPALGRGPCDAPCRRRRE